MGTTTSSIFNGTSQFSQDLQNVITRATAIATLPITSLKNQQADLTDQANALTGLDTQCQTLQRAVTSISAALSGSSYQATVSDPAKLSVTLGTGALEGNYSVDVVNPGVYATSMSAHSWVSTGTHTYQLTMDGGQTTLAIHPTTNSAAGVAAAINSQYGDQVRATVVNVGNASSPSLRVSLQATQLGTPAPDILDNGVGVQGSKVAGVQADYIVNGSGVDATSNSRLVTIATGVTVNLLKGDNSTPVNITVTRPTSALSDALTQFTSAFNATVDELNKQYGTTATPLGGQLIVRQLEQTLGTIGTYATPGATIDTLRAIGLDLDKTGHITFDPMMLAGADLGNSSAVKTFLGTPTTAGFLKAVTDSLNLVEDPYRGLLPTSEAAVTSQQTDLTNRIAAQQARVDQMTQQMQRQMAAADALISSMEQQYRYLNDMFSAMQTADAQYK